MNFYFNSKSFALKASAFFLIFLIYQSNLNAQKKPNVIFILSDDIGYDILHVNGSRTYSTPNIDSMAHHGINFTHCEGTPLCSPSRCMLLTGKYNFRNYSDWGYLSNTEKTFGNVMHDGGYKTGFFGKLQLPFSYSAMENWGFDKYTVAVITEDTLPKLRYKSPILIDNNGRVADSITLNKYGDDIFTNRIINFIDSNKNNPFFIYYPMSLAHAPFSPTPNDTAYANWNPDDTKSDTSFYHSMISYMDFKVGLILDKLAKTGLDKNTIVIFCGDNGTPSEIFYQTDSISDEEGAKASTTEKGTHVPLVAYWPGHIKEGQINDDLIDFTDFLPTFAQAADNKDLYKYGTLDGLSFYLRMLGNKDISKQQLFMHYSAHPGFDVLKRWVRDKNYKLYGSHDGSYRFYNISKDEKEKRPLNTNKLTPDEKAIKDRFAFILDSMPTWPDAPVLNNPFVKNITANSAFIGASIISSGTSQLIDRGSNLLIQDPFCILGENRMRDSMAAVGTFSEKRINLKSQTLYYCSLYAINGNESHSTAYVIDSFYTLSTPPVAQPSYFKACTNTSSVILNWGKAIFPTKGASQGGYAIFYSTDSVQLTGNPNGQNPLKIIKNGTLIPLAAKPIYGVKDTSLRVSGLQKNTKYHFLLIPYTYNGITDSTYNYLTTGALSATVNYAAPLTLNFTDKNPVCFNSKDGSIKAYAFNGTTPYSFRINNQNYTSDSVFANLSVGKYFLAVKDAQGCLDSESVVLKSTAQNCAAGINILPNPGSSVFTLTISSDQISDYIKINVYDALGKLVYSGHGTQKSSYTFGNTFMKGVYFVEVELESKTYKFKIIKE